MKYCKVIAETIAYGALGAFLWFVIKAFVVSFTDLIPIRNENKGEMAAEVYLTGVAAGKLHNAKDKYENPDIETSHRYSIRHSAERRRRTRQGCQ